MPRELNEYRVPGSDEAYYVKEYLTKEEEGKLLECIF
jgi:alkylated DNA repair protein alkB homolog 6